MYLGIYQEFIPTCTYIKWMSAFRLRQVSSVNTHLDDMELAYQLAVHKLPHFSKGTMKQQIIN